MIVCVARAPFLKGTKVPLKFNLPVKLDSRARTGEFCECAMF